MLGARPKAIRLHYQCSALRLRCPFRDIIIVWVLDPKAGPACYTDEWQGHTWHAVQAYGGYNMSGSCVIFSLGVRCRRTSLASLRPRTGTCAPAPALAAARAHRLTLARLRASMSARCSCHVWPARKQVRSKIQSIFVGGTFLCHAAHSEAGACAPAALSACLKGHRATAAMHGCSGAGEQELAAVART